MLSLVSPNGRVHVAVDDQCGARLASLRIDGVDLLVSDGPDALSWGCYPMVPYAGRVRDALVNIGGTMFPLPAIAPPHALHGTVFASPWSVIDHRDASVVLLTELDVPWPAAGTVRHEIAVADDAVVLRLEVVAHDEMPCQVGWHPWFVRPESYTIPFRSMWARDEHGITTNERVEHDSNDSPRGVFDDCFSDPVASPVLTYLSESPQERIDVTLDSDCSHWVVYDQPEHAVCLEPQSGPPNQVNDDPMQLDFGQSMARTFRIGWGITRR